MNENLNLAEILKDCPKGTKLYSSVLGDVYFYGVSEDARYPIGVTVAGNSDYRTFTSDGKLWINYDGECTLFPSREQRDWSKFKFKKERFDPKTLRPFDKVLARDMDYSNWRGTLFSHYNKDDGVLYPFVTVGEVFKVCIPYNEDTKHLVGTDDEAPEYYRYWED